MAGRGVTEADVAKLGGVEYRVLLWERGEQRELMRLWRRERKHHARCLRKRASRGRAEVVGSKWDVEDDNPLNRPPPCSEALPRGFLGTS